MKATDNGEVKSADSLKDELIALTHKLNDGGWEPDDAVKVQIRSAITDLDTDAMSLLLQQLQQAVGPALLLHNEAEEVN